MLLQTKVINQSCDKQKIQINKGEYDKCKLSINQDCDNWKTINQSELWCDDEQKNLLFLRRESAKVN